MGDEYGNEGGEFYDNDAGVEPDPCFSEILARTTFVLVILARGQKSL